MDLVEEIMFKRERLLDFFHLSPIHLVMVHSSGLEINLKGCFVRLANISDEAFEFPIGEDHRLAARGIEENEYHGQ